MGLFGYSAALGKFPQNSILSSAVALYLNEIAICLLDFVTLWRNFYSTSWVLILNAPWRDFPSSSWFAHTQKESLAPKFACLQHGMTLYCNAFFLTLGLGGVLARKIITFFPFLILTPQRSLQMLKADFLSLVRLCFSFKAWAIQGHNRVMDELGLVPLWRINLFLRTNLCTNISPKIHEGKIIICIWRNWKS